MSTHCENMSAEKIRDMQAKLKEGKEIIEYDVKVLDYARRPIGKALYNNNYEINKEIKRRKDLYIAMSKKIKCDLCGSSYRKSNKSYHIKTKKHQIYVKINDKFKRLLLDE